MDITAKTQFILIYIVINNLMSFVKMQFKLIFIETTLSKQIMFQDDSKTTLPTFITWLKKWMLVCWQESKSYASLWRHWLDSGWHVTHTHTHTHTHTLTLGFPCFMGTFYRYEFYTVQTVFCPISRRITETCKTWSI